MITRRHIHARPNITIREQTTVTGLAGKDDQ